MKNLIYRESSIVDRQYISSCCSVSYHLTVMLMMIENLVKLVISAATCSTCPSLLVVCMGCFSLC